MKIAVIGTGYVGLVTGTCLANLDNEVTCIDINEIKIKSLKQDIIPIYEPGLEKILSSAKKKNKIHFSINYEEILKAEVVIVAVGTPTDDITGETNLTQVESVLNEITKIADKFERNNVLIIIRSTVPIGTNKMLLKKIDSILNIELVYNPEFLREGSAVFDFMNPNRLVFGVNSEFAKGQLKKLYKFFEGKAPFIFTDLSSAELIKYAANTFLAMRIAFINEVTKFSDKFNANIDEVIEALGHDPRIGKEYIKPGPGFGGSCFPKDTKALSTSAIKNSIETPILNSILLSNELHKRYLAERILLILKKYNAKRIAVLGITFKANTDDIRDAASLTILPILKNAGIEIMVYDPMYKEKMPDNLKDFAHTLGINDAIKGAEAVVILTEWEEFIEMTHLDFKNMMINPLVIDFRNIYNPEQMKNNGIKYYSLGRLGLYD
ncbi:MAG: UDP-glucose/GDP-mannose dehydrogenase family protein [Sphingobacteriia bacterium]|nr:UDP-glucose/GDP-mannose dehydrogenase family protein [Sphingobacteriia bacterium]